MTESEKPSPGYVPLPIPELWEPAPVFVPASAPAVDEAPPGYVPLEMPELWEPPTEQAPEPERVPAPAAETAVAKAERAARDAWMSRPGSGAPVAAEGEWADPDAVQIRVLPSSAATGPVARQTLPAEPPGGPSAAPSTSAEPVAPRYPHPTAQLQAHRQAAQVQAYRAAQPQYAPAQQHPQAPAQQFTGARPATGAIPRPRRIPRSMQELRSGPFEGREFETPQELAVAAVLELGYPAPVIARLFRVPSYRVEEWIRTAQAQRPRVPRQGTAGRPLDR